MINVDANGRAFCGCGAEVEVIESYSLSRRRPNYHVIGEVDPCRCARCVCCGVKLTDDRCPTLDCPVFDVIQPLPDR